MGMRRPRLSPPSLIVTAAAEYARTMVLAIECLERQGLTARRAIDALNIGGESAAAKASERPPVVLVVDDDSDTRVLLCEAVQALGYRAVEAADGREALRKLAAGLLPGLVLLDVMMPHINGLEALSLMRANPRWEHVPVIIMTGAASVSAMGALAPDDWMRKPIALNDLEGRIRATMDRAKRAEG